MNNNIINFSLIFSALSAIIVALTFFYKSFFYDPINDWKLVADKKNHVYVVRNRGEEICYFDSRKSDMSTGTNGRNITGKWVKTNCK